MLRSATDADATLHRQRLALVHLARSPALAAGDLPAFYRTLTAEVASALAVARVAVWLLDPARVEIRCVACHEAGVSGAGPDLGASFSRIAHPRYFAALEQARVIDAGDALADPRTAEFARDHLVPRGIGALLDAPVRDRGAVIGVVCHEHRGGPRRWSSDEAHFAAAVADLVALAVSTDERARAEAAAHESEARWRAMVEGAGDVIFRLGPDRTLLDVNAPSFERLTGFAKSQWIGRPAFHLVAPPDRAAMREAIARTRAGEECVRVTARIRTAAGAWRVAEIVLSRLPERDGGVLGVARDVTERTTAERRSRMLLELVRLADGASSLDDLLRGVAACVQAELPCDGAVITHRHAPEAEPEVVACAGLAPDAAAGHLRGIPLPSCGAGVEVTELRDPGLDFVQVAAVTVARDAGAHQYRLLALARERGALDASAPELLEAVGRQTGAAIATVRARLARESGIRVREGMAHVGRALISSVDEPVLLERLCVATRETLGADVARTYRWRPHRAVFELVAIDGPLTGALAVPGVSVIPEHVVAPLHAALEREDVVVLSRDDVPGLVEPSLWAASGLATVVAMALRAGDELVGMHTAGRGSATPFSTEQRRVGAAIAKLASLALANAALVERLARADRLKSELVATVSHELRTPVNVIVGYADMLAEGACGPLGPEAVGVLERVAVNARTLARLVDTALDLSRLEAGGVRLALGPVDLEILVDEVLVEARAAARPAGPALHGAVPAGLPPVRTDREKLRLVLSNLVGNAMKFTERGTVRVAAVRAGDGVEIRVQDTGPGIPPDERELIFEAFRQGSGERRRGGVGLGLHLVRRLVDALGGSVGVESEVGRGSTFRVWLPAGGPGQPARDPAALVGD